MDSDEDDREKAEAHENNDRTNDQAPENGEIHEIAEPTSHRSRTGDIHTVYEKRAQQYLQLSDGGKALSNALEALRHRNDSFNAHWLVGKAYVSMAMYDHSIQALTTAIELCCLEDKRQDIVIDLLLFCCCKRSKFETGVLKKIPGHTWAKVAYELTKTRRFEAAYMAYSQLQDKNDHIRSGISVDLEPLCDPETVTTEIWILDLVTWFLRQGSDHDTMTSYAGDTYIHVVVRMTLAAGMLGLLEYVLKNVARPGELRTLVDCLGNTALHMAAQCQKCSPIVRLDVMTLLEAGIDATTRNVEGKTAGSYLLREENGILQCHQEYHSICSAIMTKKTKHAMDKIYDIVEIARGEDENKDGIQDVHMEIQGRQTTARMCNNTESPLIRPKEDNKSDTIEKENSFQIENQNRNSQGQSVSVFEGERRYVKESAIPAPENVDKTSPNNLTLDQQSINECFPVESGSNKTASRGLETTMKLVPNGLPEELADKITEKRETATSILTDVSQINANAEYEHLNVVKASDGGEDNSVIAFPLTGSSKDEFCDGEMKYDVSLNKPTSKLSQDNSVTEVLSKINGSDDLEKGKKKENGSREIAGDVTSNENMSTSYKVELSGNGSVNLQYDSTDLYPEDMIAKANSCGQTSDEYSQPDVGHRTVETDEHQIPVYASPASIYRLIEMVDEEENLNLPRDKEKEEGVSQAENKTEEELSMENEIEDVQQKEKEKDCEGRRDDPSELESEESTITQKVQKVKSLKKDRLDMWNKDKGVGREDENKVDNDNNDEFTASKAKKQVEDGINKENVEKLNKMVRQDENASPDRRPQEEQQLQKFQQASVATAPKLPTTKTQMSNLQTTKPQMSNLQTAKPQMSNLQTTKPQMSNLPTTKPKKSSSKKNSKEVLDYQPDHQNPPKMEERAMSQRSRIGQKKTKSTNKKETIPQEKLDKPVRQDGANSNAGSQREEQQVTTVNNENLEVDEEDRQGNIVSEIAAELDGLPWEVECTKSFVKTMTSKIDYKIKNRIILVISELAKGNWHPSNSKELNNTHKPKNVQLYEAKIGKGSRMIWQRAITFSSKLSVPTVGNKEAPGNGLYSEVIRIWNYVSSHDEIYKHVVNICNALQNENQADVKRNPKLPSEQTLPAFFGPDCKEITDMRPPVKVANEEFQIVKFYTFSPDMLEQICKQSSPDVDFPFRVTELEHSIINLPSAAPILLIGRSGTGKTTCCLYRLWHHFIAELNKYSEEQEPAILESGSENCHEGQDQVQDLNKELGEDNQLMVDDSVHNRLHQIFVTRNSFLCSEAKRNFMKMKQGSSIANKIDLFDDGQLPWRFDDIRDSQYPLFLTLDQLLTLLDGSVGPSFFYARENDGSRKGAKKVLFEEDSSISGITGRIQRGGNVDHIDLRGLSKSKEASKQKTEVTYQVFCETVWPKIGTGCKYQPLLVWTEFISIIKGSYESLKQSKGYLSRDLYFDVGRKRAPNFDGNRKEIYDLFQKYQTVLAKKNMFDECDLIYSINSRLKQQHVDVWAVQQLFVDEIQDFTQAELYLLIKICQDPNHMFLTGDTAQTVMHGIEFRFCDLQALFFEIRKSLKNDGFQGKYLVEVPKHVHQLTHSYRSHDGILSLASSILDVMAHLFPDSFDRLHTDKSLIEGGPLPVLFESSNFSDLVRHISDNKEGSEDTADIELGVHQAILVINEIARQQLPRQLQQNITLTIYESKGLEFNNIFLFNFFKFSQASKEWRTVTSVLTELTQDDEVTPKSRTGMYELDESKLYGKGKFDPKLYKVLNSELKLLYTAVTRARVNVWIFDEDEEKRRPMFDYFRARKLVNVKTESFIKDNRTSEKDDWLKRGEDFRRTQVYREAAKCFEKGGDMQSAAEAKAYNSEQIAHTMRDQTSRKSKFLQTAELFQKCGLDSRAIECLMVVNAFEEAAMYCKEIGKFEEAAKIYSKRLNNPVKCSECYEAAHQFDIAVDVLCKSANYEKALHIVSRYEQQLADIESANETIPQLMKEHHPCKVYKKEELYIKCAERYHREYRQNHEDEKAEDNDNNLDENLDKMNFYLGHLSFDKQRKLLLKWNHINLAVDLMLTKGMYEEASRELLSRGWSKKALAMARKSDNKKCIAQYLLWDIQFEMCTHQELDKSHISEQLQEVFRLLSLIEVNQQLQGQAHLHKAELRNRGEEPDPATDEELAKALKAFRKCDPPCKAGEIDCLNMMLKRLTQSNVPTVIKAMHTLFGAIQLLEKTTTLTEDESRAIQSLHNYYGYEQTTDGSTLTKIRHHYLNPEITRRCKPEDEDEVKNAICIVLKENAYDWYNEIQSSLKGWIENPQPCKASYHGELRCGCLKRILELDMFHMELDGYLAKTLQCINITDKKTIMASFEPCKTFICHLLPKQFQKRSAKADWYSLADLVRKTEMSVKERLVMSLKSDYNDVTQNKRKQSMDLFMKQYFVVKYLKLDLKPHEMRQTFERILCSEVSGKQNKKKALGKYRKFGCLIYPKSEQVESLAVRFVEAYDNLSDDLDAMGAFMKFTTILKLLRGYDPEVIPDQNFFLMWMEYFFVVGSYLATKVDNKMTFLLPNSYTHVVNFIDSSFDSKQQTTVDAVVRTRKDLKSEIIQDRIGDIALFLCKDGFRKGLMNIVFSSTDTDFEVCERVMMLSLTCMCNMGHLRNRSSEQLLLSHLRSIQLPKTAPPRLMEAIDKLKTAKGLLDVGNVFRALLFQRGEELHSYSFVKRNVLTTPVTILNGTLPDSFYEVAIQVEQEQHGRRTREEHVQTEQKEPALVQQHQPDVTVGLVNIGETKVTSVVSESKETYNPYACSGTKQNDASLTLFQAPAADDSGKCGDTVSENTNRNTLKTPWKDLSENIGNAEYQGATFGLLQTKNTETSRARENTQFMEDEKLAQKEAESRQEAGQPEPNDVSGIDWFSLPYSTR